MKFASSLEYMSVGSAASHLQTLSLEPRLAEVLPSQLHHGEYATSEVSVWRKGQSDGLPRCCWKSNIGVACLLCLLARTQSRGPNVTVEEAGRGAGSTLLTKYRTLCLWRETLAGFQEEGVTGHIEKLLSFCQKYFGGMKMGERFPSPPEYIFYLRQSLINQFIMNLWAYFLFSIYSLDAKLWNVSDVSIVEQGPITW